MYQSFKNDWKGSLKEAVWIKKKVNVDFKQFWNRS